VGFRTINRGVFKEDPEWRCRYLPKVCVPNSRIYLFLVFWSYIIIVHPFIFVLSFYFFPDILYSSAVPWTRATFATHWWRHFPFMTLISDGNLWSSFSAFAIIGAVFFQRHSHLIPSLYSLPRFSWTLYLLHSFNSSNSFEQHCADPILLFAQASCAPTAISTPIQASAATWINISLVYNKNTTAVFSNPNIPHTPPMSLQLLGARYGSPWTRVTLCARGVSCFQGWCTEPPGKSESFVLASPLLASSTPHAVSSENPSSQWIAASSKRFCSSVLHPILYAIYLTLFFSLHSTALSASHCNAKANKWFCILHSVSWDFTDDQCQ